MTPEFQKSIDKAATPVNRKPTNKERNMNPSKADEQRVRSIYLEVVGEMLSRVDTALLTSHPGIGVVAQEVHADCLRRVTGYADTLIIIAERAWGKVMLERDEGARDEEALAWAVLRHLSVQQKDFDHLALDLNVGNCELALVVDKMQGLGLVDTNRKGKLLTRKGRRVLRDGEQSKILGERITTRDPE